MHRILKQGRKIDTSELEMDQQSIIEICCQLKPSLSKVKGSVDNKLVIMDNGGLKSRLGHFILFKLKGLIKTNNTFCLLWRINETVKRPLFSAGLCNRWPMSRK